MLGNNPVCVAPVPRAAPADLLRQIEAWLCTTMHHTAPMVSVSVKERLFRQKCLNELAFYVNFRDMCQLPLSAEAARICEFVVGNWSSEYLEWACRRPLQSLVHAQTFALLARRGRQDADTVHMLQQLLAGAFCWHTELLACRQLDLLVACRQAGVAEPIDVDTVIAASSLMLPPSPLLSDTEAFYSFTHAVGFAYLLQPQRPELPLRTASALEGGLCRALAGANMDLASELLLCQIVSGMALDGAARLAYGALADGLTRGDLSDTLGNSSALKDFLAERPTEQWAKAFHLMFLAALVLTALETSPRLEELLAGPFDDSFALTYGRCAQHLQRHQIVAGLDAAALLAPANERQWRLMRGINEHVGSLRNPDGSFGRFFDERRLYLANAPGGRFDDLIVPARDACVRHLARAATHPIDEGVL
jgi:hypothetical protein